jgi:RNA polymerase sigma-70 factor (ECF subfamily)
VIDPSLLIERARSGDEGAFSDLVRSYTPYVYRTAFALMHDEMESEDIVQEVFIKLYRSLRQLSEIRAFHSWLTRIITNQCLDHLKKKTAIPVEDSAFDLLSSNESDNCDERLILEEAMKQLNNDQRTVLMLRVWQGYDYQEIAEILGIPLGTVKSRIYLARAQLRTLLRDKKFMKEG